MSYEKETASSSPKPVAKHRKERTKVKTNYDVHAEGMNTATATPILVNLKTLAKQLDAHRSSIRRWLSEAGIQPVAVGNGPKGAIRYRWPDVEAWLKDLKVVV
jgi:hypothetical protein